MGNNRNSTKALAHKAAVEAKTYRQEYAVTYTIPAQTGEYLVMATSFEDAKKKFAEEKFTNLFNQSEGDDPEIVFISNADTDERFMPEEIVYTGTVAR